MAKGKGSNTRPAKVVNTAAASSGANTKKIIAIIFGVAVIIALLLGLTCCNKDTDPKKLQGKVIKDKNKKDKKKKEEVEDVVISYNNISDVAPVQMAFNPSAAVATNNAAEEEEEADTTDPVVTLNGSSTITLEFGVDVYSEQGATYSDDVDGDGTIDEPTRITLDGSSVQFVANDIIGEYTLIYTYTDAAGNTGIATRTVIVQDTVGPVVVATKTNETNYRAAYSFDVSDQAGVEIVKIAQKDDTIEQDEEWFESNGTELTDPYEYEIRANSEYILFARDNNGNCSFTAVTVDFIEALTITDEEKASLFTVGSRYQTTTGSGMQQRRYYNKDVTVNEVENVTITDLKSRKSGNAINNISANSFTGNNTTTYDAENTDTITLSDRQGNGFGASGDEYHYIYAGLSKTVDEVTVTDEYITPAIRPAQQ